MIEARLGQRGRKTTASPQCRRKKQLYLILIIIIMLCAAVQQHRSSFMCDTNAIQIYPTELAHDCMPEKRYWPSHKVDH